MQRLPILFAGAGAMGGAMIAGWRRAGAVNASDMVIRDPAPGEAALAARDAGARLNPADELLRDARIVIFAVKPQVWRAAAAELEPHLAPDAAIVSVIAGVATAALSRAFAARPVVRAMPTLASAIGQGSIALWSADAAVAAEVAALFSALGAVTTLADEDQMHVATAASGSAPAYLYTFIEALQAAAAKAGLPADDAKRMVRATICGAAALLAESDEDPAALRRRVTSPGGTTEAALARLMDHDALSALLDGAVAAAVVRSRELGSKEPER
jgi:pyrroline-5-carboxylate reductase